MNVQYGKAIGVGIALGTAGGTVASGFTLVSLLCCVANLVGYLGPALSGICAAIVGAALQSTTDTEQGQEILQGAMAGVVAAAAGALTCAVIFGLMQFLNPVLTGLIYAIKADDAGDVVTAIMAVISTGVWAAVIAIGVGIVSSLGGVLGGAISGAVVGAIKGAMRNG